MESKYYWVNINFSKCLRIADVNKLGYYLIMYIHETCKIYRNKNHNNYAVSIKFNENEIDRECFRKPNGKCTKRALEHLCSKNILIFNPETKRIRINFNTKTWDVTDEQYDKILAVINE